MELFEIYSESEETDDTQHLDQTEHASEDEILSLELVAQNIRTSDSTVTSDIQFALKAELQATRAMQEGDEDTLRRLVPSGAADMTSSCKVVNLESQQFQMIDQAWEARLDAKMDAILAKHIAGLNGSIERVEGVQDMCCNDD